MNNQKAFCKQITFYKDHDEWIPDTSKTTPDVTLEPARHIVQVSQAAQSLRDFYAWGCK